MTGISLLAVSAGARDDRPVPTPCGVALISVFIMP